MHVHMYAHIFIYRVICMHVLSVNNTAFRLSRVSKKSPVCGDEATAGPPEDRSPTSLTREFSHNNVGIGIRAIWTDRKSVV